MPGASASIERGGFDPLALERLIGARPAEPSFHTASHEKPARQVRTIETLERISSALCAAPAGPVAVCDAVVEAAAHLFDARWAALVFAGEYPGVGMARVFVHAGDCVIERWMLAPRMLEVLTERTLVAQQPLLAEHDEGLECGTLSGVLVAAPMPVDGKLAGMLVVGVADDAEVAPGDVSILVTLANHAGVALHNASLFQENGGLTNREIGRRMFVSERTAKFHVRNVMRKLGVHSRVEVAYAAGERGLLGPPPS